MTQLQTGARNILTQSGVASRAREEGFDMIAAECISIADATENDSIQTEHGPIPNGEWIQRSKVRVETRLKLLAKWSKRYADQRQATVNVGVQVNQMTDEDRKQRIAEIYGRS